MTCWHYTIGLNFVRISASRTLLPATAGLRGQELPIVWFSLHQHFEPTARKAWFNRTTGTIRILSVQETRERGEGLFRFGVDPKMLLSGEALRRAARMSRKVWRQLHNAGLRQNADPAHWLGHVGQMSIDGMVIEVMNDAGHWVPAPEAYAKDSGSRPEA